MNNNYFLLLFEHSNWQDSNTDVSYHHRRWLILINSNNDTKQLLTIEDNTYSNSYLSLESSMHLIHKNIFMILAGVNLYCFEFFEKNEKIQLITKNFFFNQPYQYIKAFEFNKNYCIFSTHNELLFYNWKKNKIVRRFFIQHCKISELINVNKYNFVGICNDSPPGSKTQFFIYNLIDDSFKTFEISLSFIPDEIINLYNNYFLVFDESHSQFSFIKISENGIACVN